ncbi:MAG: thiol peroxidase [Gammaproteobacteria bacterium]|nr:thiol peroxidase [Gammaproteobacteria bacterium]
MATTSLQGNTCNTNASLPEIGSDAPRFTLLSTKLKEKSLADFGEHRKFIYTVPSLDTMVCENTAKKLNEMAAEHDDVDFLVVSADLVFAQQRFCKHNKLKNVTTLSMMRSRSFAEDYGVLLVNGPLAGLSARAVFVLDGDNKILHFELVSDIANEPDFESAFHALTNAANS